MKSNDDSPLLFSDDSTKNSILSDKEISEFSATGKLITPNTFSESCLSPSSYDIRVGAVGIIGGEGLVHDLKDDVLELSPGAYGGILSYEKLCLTKNICARIGTKRTLSYDGIILLTGSIVDPGYEGHLLFGLYNASQKKAIIRQGRKICNLVFERINSVSDLQTTFDPSLRIGQFPDEFIDKMANMDVLPWMQISNRVKQIEQITKDILDLKARYEDVLQPIRDLTKTVADLAKDIESLTLQSKNIAKDLNDAKDLATENSKQISQLTNNLTLLSGQTQYVKSDVEQIRNDTSGQLEKIAEVKTDFGRFKVLVYFFWAILLLVAGAFLPKLIDILFS